MEGYRCPVCQDDLWIKQGQPEKVNLGSESKPERFYLFTCEHRHNLCNKKNILG